MAPIGKIIDLCERTGALSYIDDANGFMVYGEPQRPFYEEFKHINRADFIMVSLSKSIGLEGGAISANAEFIDAFEVLSGTSIFTAAIQPPTAGTATIIIKRLHDDPSIMDNYVYRTREFRQILLDSGLPLNEDPSFITSVLIGNEMKAEHVRESLEEEGFCVPIFRYPAVKPNQAIMRLILHKDHSDADIRCFAELLTKLLKDIPEATGRTPYVI